MIVGRGIGGRGTYNFKERINGGCVRARPIPLFSVPRHLFLILAFCLLVLPATCIRRAGPLPEGQRRRLRPCSS